MAEKMILEFNWVKKKITVDFCVYLRQILNVVSVRSDDFGAFSARNGESVCHAILTGQQTDHIAIYIGKKAVAAKLI